MRHKFIDPYTTTPSAASSIIEKGKWLRDILVVAVNVLIRN